MALLASSRTRRTSDNHFTTFRLSKSDEDKDPEIADQHQISYGTLLLFFEVVLGDGDDFGYKYGVYHGTRDLSSPDLQIRDLRAYGA